MTHPLEGDQRSESINLDPRLAKLRSARRNWGESYGSYSLFAKSNAFPFLENLLKHLPYVEVDYPQNGTWEHVFGLYEITQEAGYPNTYKKSSMLIRKDEGLKITVNILRFADLASISRQIDQGRTEFSERIGKDQLTIPNRALLTVRDALIVAGFYRTSGNNQTSYDVSVQQPQTSRTNELFPRKSIPLLGQGPTR